MDWRGYKKKEANLKYNEITPILHSRLMEQTNIKCCCNNPLELHSEFYVFKVTTKRTNKNYFIHAGSGCGKDLIKLSNSINSTNFQNIYFLDPLHINKENEVIKGYGLKRFNEPNDIKLYTKHNRTYLISIFLLCYTWNQPFPYGKLAEIIDEIHSYPNDDCYLHIESFNEFIKKDFKKRTLSLMLAEYREKFPNAFSSLDLNILHDLINQKTKSESMIIRNECMH